MWTIANSYSAILIVCTVMCIPHMLVVRGRGLLPTRWFWSSKASRRETVEDEMVPSKAEKFWTHAFESSVCFLLNPQGFSAEYCATVLRYYSTTRSLVLNTPSLGAWSWQCLPCDILFRYPFPFETKSQGSNPLQLNKLIPPFSRSSLHINYTSVLSIPLNIWCTF